MKNMIKLPVIVIGIILLFTGTSQKVMAQDDVSLQTFYDELSPYGTWIQDREYGYVWRPDVDQAEFRPYYSNGRWVMTEYGNTWVSDYDWGWGPFHYGRWAYNRYNQWVWVPDTVWGPAWVSWRSGGGYYGWAPLGPGIHVSVGIPSLWWVFVPQRNIYYNRFPRYYSHRNVTIINRTTIINNTYVRNNRTYYSGPRASDIRHATNRDVRVYDINRTSRPSRSTVSNNAVSIYTPRPSRTSSTTPPAPKNVSPGSAYTNSRGGRTVSGGSTEAGSSRGVSAENGRSNTTGNTSSARPGTSSSSSRPSRTEQPQAQPSQSRSPERSTTPQREVAPSRSATPERQAAPSREARPQSQPAPQRQATPAPQREAAPAPQRQAAPAPQRQSAPPQRTVSPAPSSSRSSAPSSRGSSGGSSSSRPSRGGRS